MPSISEGFSPASRIALRTAQVPRARVVLPEPRVYRVSPTPTIAYLSRRYFGVVASTSLGSGIFSLPISDIRRSLPLTLPLTWAPPSPRCRGARDPHSAPSPRLRGEGWGEGLELTRPNDRPSQRRR